MTDSVGHLQYFEADSFDDVVALVDGSDEMADEEVWDALRNDWRGVVQENFNPDKPDRFPGYDLNIDGTVYRIRGLSHGQPGTDLSLEEDSIETIEGHIESYSKEGPVYTEQGFFELFEPLKAEANVYELHDISTAFKSHPEEMREARRILEEGVEMANIFADLFDLSPTPENLREDFIRARGDNLPLQIKEDYEKEKNKTQYLLDAVRSKNQLDEVISRSPDNIDGPVTLLVGIRHVPQIRDYATDHYDAEVSTDYFSD
jgi:hypothetical protein